MGKCRLRRSSDELVAEAIRLPNRAIRIAQTVQRLPPCESSARRVSEALRDRRIDHWESALLLTSIGHPIGFEAVCGMFDDPRLSYAGSYLATALLHLDAPRAHAQLIRFVEHAATQVGCDEAVWGLAQLQQTIAGRNALLKSSAAGRVSVEVAAPVLICWGVEPSVIEGWLTSGERPEANIACGVVAIGAWLTTASSGPYRWTEEDRGRLLQLAQEAITRGFADPKPYVRTGLRRPSSHRLLRARI